MPEKRTLRDASVNAAVFLDQALHAVDAQAADTLPRLTGCDLVRRQSGRGFEGARR